MGAWGTGYSQSDFYFDEISEYHSIVWGKFLNKTDRYNGDELRSVLVGVMKMMIASDYTVSMSEKVYIQKIIDSIRNSLDSIAEDWNSPEEYSAVVTRELDLIGQWLNGEDDGTGLLTLDYDGLLETIVTKMENN